MNVLTWVIVGATSPIAQAYAKIAAEHDHPLLLVGRDAAELDIIACDLRLRYAIPCGYYVVDLEKDISAFLQFITEQTEDLALFIAVSSIEPNANLSPQRLESLLQVNVLNTYQLIHCYRNKSQQQHRLVFLSSVAACRGRFKNSAYGGSKAAVENYLEGLQQGIERPAQDSITIARLGFIDTSQTYGIPGIFYASQPIDCAKACWQAASVGKRWLYYPFFWKYIMTVIRNLPFFLYRRLSQV